jgi:hypothetical protein
MNSKINLDKLRKVRIQTGGEAVWGWEAKDPALRNLGRWTDPQGLLQRIHEIQHPESAPDPRPGRQWQATWRGQFSSTARRRGRKAA